MNQEIEDRINYLAGKHGHITPDMVVMDAKDPDSPLHGEFEWDTDKAAEAYWLDQARSIIRSVKVIIVVDSKTIKTVAYVRDPDKDNGEQGYLSVESIKADKDKSRDVLIEEFNRAGSALKRARRLAAVFNCEDQVDSMVESVNTLSEQIAEQILHS